MQDNSSAFNALVMTAVYTLNVMKREEASEIRKIARKYPQPVSPKIRKTRRVRSLQKSVPRVLVPMPATYTLRKTDVAFFHNITGKRTCEVCRTLLTPQWRGNMCNACGCRWTRKHGH